jgi:hypothetical protein
LQVKAEGAHVQDLDASHIAWIGDDTAKNINPHHLTLESNEINQTRKGCFSMLEAVMRGGQGVGDWNCLVLSLEAPDLSEEQVDRSMTPFLSLYISYLGLVCFNHS